MWFACPLLDKTRNNALDFMVIYEALLIHSLSLSVLYHSSTLQLHKLWEDRLWVWNGWRLHGLYILYRGEGAARTHLHQPGQPGPSWTTFLLSERWRSAQHALLLWRLLQQYWPQSPRWASVIKRQSSGILTLFQSVKFKVISAFLTQSQQRQKIGQEAPGDQWSWWQSSLGQCFFSVCCWWSACSCSSIIRGPTATGRDWR